MKPANLAVKFALELAALAAFGYWGATVGRGPLAVLLAVAAPAAMIVVWGRFAAPRSPRRLPVRPRIAVELLVFALAALALAAAGQRILALVLAAALVVNAALMTAFRQWEA